MLREGAAMKTMAIRLEDDVHAQLVVLAQLDESSVADQIREAIERHIAEKRATPDFAGRAQAVLAEIEREANARRNAIQSLFGDQTETAEEPTPSKARPGRKTAGPGSE